jgi:hypothetical protein
VKHRWTHCLLAVLDSISNVLWRTRGALVVDQLDAGEFVDGFNRSSNRVIEQHAALRFLCIAAGRLLLFVVMALSRRCHGAVMALSAGSWILQTRIFFRRKLYSKTFLSGTIVVPGEYLVKTIMPNIILCILPVPVYYTTLQWDVSSSYA